MGRTGGGGIHIGELGTDREAYARGGDELGKEELGPVVSASLELPWTRTERLLCAVGAKGSDEECCVIEGETVIAGDEGWPLMQPACMQLEEGTGQ